MYVCMYVYTYVCIRIYIYVYTYIYTYKINTFSWVSCQISAITQSIAWPHLANAPALYPRRLRHVLRVCVCVCVCVFAKKKKTGRALRFTWPRRRVWVCPQAWTTIVHTARGVSYPALDTAPQVAPACLSKAAWRVVHE
jgi:hypothetical protein